MEEPTSSLFRLEVPKGVLDLGHCLLNDTHVLRSFRITNLTDAVLPVSIVCDTPDAVSFQLANENLAGIPAETVLASSLQEERFNNLYDEVDVVRSFSIEAKESKDLIVCLRPEVVALDEADEDEDPDAEHNAAQSIEFRSLVTFSAASSATVQPARTFDSPLKLRAYLARSLIKPTLREVSFDCCVAGSTATKDFKLWNKSPFPTKVLFAAKPSDSVDEGEVHLIIAQPTDTQEVRLGGEVFVPADAQLPIRLVFHPQRPGKRRVDYEFRNLNDYRNVEVISLTALVSTQEHTDALEISERHLDFGDCYTGVACSLRLLLRNRGENPLDLFFASDSVGAVSFALPSDLTGLAASRDVKANVSRIDETVINPGKDRLIEVWYRPERPEGISDKVACRLTKQRFRVVLSWTADGHQHERIVTCEARVCTSMIATNGVINLGDCSLGVQKTSSLDVENLSDLPALVTIEVESKVISFRKTQKANIPPKQKYSFAMTYLARKVNPDYQKEIKVVNLMNTRNAPIVTVRGRNVEANAVLHSHLYRVVFPKNATSLVFNTCVLNSPKLRTFCIQSACQSPLELHFTASLPSMLRLYIENTSQSLPPVSASSRPDFADLPATARADYLDLAVPRLGKAASTSILRPSESSGPPPPTIKTEQLLTLAELEDGLGLLLDNPIPIAQEQEDAAVTRTHMVLRDLERYLTQGRLVPLDKLTLPPGAQVVICAVLTATKAVYRLSGKLQQLEARISISLTQADSEKPVISREVIAKAKICQSIMSLEQKNFNFGSVDKKEALTASIVINNLSQVPIVYRITKSKTLSSYDIMLNSRATLGVIRPYRSKEVEFLFKPSMSGGFYEKLSIHNAHDPSNSQTLLVKANVRVPNVFYVTTLQLHFGSCGLDRKSAAEKILVVNSSRQRRQVEVIADTSSFENYCVPQLLFKTSKSSSFSKDVENEVDRLERRIRIALRKNQPEKLAMLTEQLNKLKQESESVSSEENTQPWKENGITVTIEPGAMQTPIAAEDGTGSILVYESGNVDATQKIAYTATVQFEPILEMSSSLLDLAPLKSIPQHLKPVANRSPSPLRIPLKAIPSVVDLGEVSVGQETRGAFMLSNSLTTAVYYQLSFKPADSSKDVPAPRIRFSHSDGYLTGMGRSRIDFTLQPTLSGPQTHTVLVQGRGGAEVSVQLQLRASQPRYLAYPDMKNAELPIDLGYCYVDSNKKYSKVEPFRIQNVSTEALTLTIRSNLATQVFVFQDEALSLPVDNVRLVPGGRLTVHVCVQPSLKGDSLTRGNCRELVATNAMQYVAVDKTAKFHAIVGRSEFNVAPLFVDLGATRLRGKRYNGWITISNVSSLLPLSYTIEPSKRLTLSRVSGQLDGVETSGGRSQDRIQFTFSAAEPGLYEDRLAVVNALGQRVEVNFRLFVDEALLITNLEQNNLGCDVLEFRELYVTTEKPYERKPEAELAAAPPALVCTSSGNFTFSLSNMTKRDLLLVPKSNLDLTLSWLAPRGPPPPSSDAIPPVVIDANGIRQVGDAFTLRANRKLPVYVTFPRPTNLPLSRLSRVLQGNKILFHGALMFERVEKEAKTKPGAPPPAVVSKMLVVEGSYCISMAELDNKVLDLGRIGYETAWREVLFEFQVKNLSEVQFLGRLPTLPPEISITNSTNVFRIPPFKQRTVKAVLHPKKIANPSAGPCQFTIAVLNDNNPSNNLQLQLNAHVTICLLKFGHLDFVSGSPVLAFPTLKHVPSLTPESVDEWFSVENTSIKPVTVTLEPQLDIGKDFITALVYPRSAMAPVSSFSLNPNESLELRVRLTAKPDARLPKSFGTDPVQLGVLLVRSKVEQASEQDAVSERIALRGALIPGTSFALSSTRLGFQLPSAEDITKAPSLTESFSIKNLATVPLRFALVPPSVSTFPAAVSASPMEGVVPVGSSTSVAITVENWKEQAATGQHMYLVQDSESAEAPQKLIVALAGQRQAMFERRESFKTQPALEPIEKPPPLLTESSSGQLVQPPPQPPTLQLRGCTPTDDPHRYEINLGQQTVGQENLRWEFSIVYTGSNSGELLYKLYSTNPMAKSWLTVDHPRGSLKAPGESQKITLTFKPKACEIFSTFLVLDNFSNLEDVKTIKVYMEGITAQTSTFSVYVDPLAAMPGPQDESGLSINMGSLYFGQISSDRSFIISNLSASPLDFLLSSNVGANAADPLMRSTQLHFSLSSAESSMSLSNIIVPPHSKQVVFIYLLVQVPHALRIEEEESVELSALVNVECRMVKNSLRSIPVKAHCRLPQIEVQPARLFWVCRLTRREDTSQPSSDAPASKAPADQDPVITFDGGNMGKQITLKNQYIAKNDSMFFDVECASTGWIGSKYVTHSISVLPNVNTIAKHRKFLMKERAIEEHIVVYNQNRISEKYRITLHLTLDLGAQSADASFVPVPSALHAIATLEQHISTFVVGFNSFWKDHRKGDDRVSRLEARLAQLEESHEDFALHFEFLHLTDELIFYGTRRSHVSGNVFALANLLYITVFKHKIFAKTAAHNPSLLERLSKWSKGLRWYLSFFPEVGELAYLRKVEQEVSTYARRHKTPTQRERATTPDVTTRRPDKTPTPERDARATSPSPSVAAAGRGTSPLKHIVRPTSPGIPALRYPQ